MIDIRKAYAYFKRRFVLKRTSQGWLATECPFQCKGSEGKKNKFAVKFDWERSKCWLCGYSANLEEFVMDYEGVNYQDAKEIINQEEDIGVDADVFHAVAVVKRSSISMPTGYQSILSGEGIIGVRARAYLQRRGFDLDKLDMKGYGYCNQHNENYKDDYFGRIIIPFKNKGILQYYIGRDFMNPDEKMKYKNPETASIGIGKSDILYNEDALDLYDEVWVVEGVLDAETIGPFGIATLGWKLSQVQQGKLLRSKVKRIVFCPDKKNATVNFYAEAVRAAMYFMDHKDIFVIDIDKIEGDGKDINELGKGVFLEVRKKTPKLTYKMVMDVLND